MTTQPSSTILKIKPPENWWKFALATFVIIIPLIFGYYSFSLKPTTSPPKPDDILVTKLPTGEQLVENRSWGSSLRIPGDWLVDKTKEQFYSSAGDVQCKVSTAVFNTDRLKTVEELKLEREANLSYLGLTVIKKDYETINVSGHQALKSTLTTEENGYSVVVSVPLGNKVYSYELYSDLSNSDRCNEYFSNILGTIAI